MTKEEIQVLSIQFQDEEVGIFKGLIRKLLKLAKRPGYINEFSNEEKELIRNLNEEESNNE